MSSTIAVPLVQAASIRRWIARWRVRNTWGSQLYLARSANGDCAGAFVELCGAVLEQRQHQATICVEESSR
jgi:hypothetical protein